MAIVFNALFGSAQSKTAGTSLQTNPADITVAAGDDLFLAYAGDDVGSAFGVTHGGTASITWTQEKEEINSGNVKAQLWRGAVTVGGTVTDVTISWTTNVTAKAIVVGWYSGVGTRRDTSSGQSTAVQVTAYVAVTDTSQAAWTETDTTEWFIDDLVIGCGGHEGPNDTYSAGQTGATWSSGPTLVGADFTAGGGAATNISACLVHGIASSDETAAGAANLFSSSGLNRDTAGAGAVYAPAAPKLSPPFGTPGVDRDRYQLRAR